MCVLGGERGVWMSGSLMTVAIQKSRLGLYRCSDVQGRDYIVLWDVCVVWCGACCSIKAGSGEAVCSATLPQHSPENNTS